MRKGKTIAVILAGLIFCSGCLRVWPIVRRPAVFTSDALFADYRGAKARISFASVEVKTINATPEIAAALQKMLVTALVNSNRFALGQLPAEAELVLSIRLSEFTPESSGGRSGLGGAGSAASGALGGLLGASLNKARIALDIRLTDALTSELIAARQIESLASDISGAIMTGTAAEWGLSEPLAIYVGTPLEKAIRMSIIECMRYLAQVVPQKYYRHKE